ncbi:cobalt-precorrin 5A hydrolase [bacterium]|nr:cobalt-precorrin 5A hydrolase [bacterium]
MQISIIAITGNGTRLGARLAGGLPGSVLHLPPKLADQTAYPCSVFQECLKELVVRLWHESDGLVCIMASGIVVRMIAPLLEGKDRDPAVVVMDDAGRFAVSLLSGHLGGANELAGRCALLAGATPVITTATDANGLPSFDMIAKEQGWVIEDLSRVKVLNTLLLENGEIAVVDPTGQVEQAFCGRGRLTFHADFQAAFRSSAKGFLFVTNRRLPSQLLTPDLLVLRPRNLVLGIGCNSGTDAEEIEEVVLSNLKRLFLSLKSVCCIASATAKRSEPGLLAFARMHSLPVRFYESDELNSVPAPSPPSHYAMDAIGATGVAEPAAILASGGGHLLLKKEKSGNVTLAIAEIP